MLRAVASRILKGGLLLALLGVFAVGALMASLWLEHRTPVALPTPTGPHPVGRVIYDWTDETTPDALVPGARRELLVWIWYPAADRPPPAGTSDYMPARLRVEIEHARPVLVTQFLTRDLSKVRTNSTVDADMSPQERAHPIVLMRAGASAEVVHYSTLAEDLASHGYVVVAFDAPYRTGLVAFPDGRVIREASENNPELCVGRTGEERDRCANRV